MAGLVKTFIRGVGTLGAVMGVLMLIPLPSMLHGMSKSGVGAALAFLAAPTLIAAYMIWIGYLIWFRFSPRAVQQCCGLLGFLILVTTSQLLMSGERLSQTMRGPLGPLGALALLAMLLAVLLAVLWGYRRLTRLFNRVLFPAEARAVVIEGSQDGPS